MYKHVVDNTVLHFLIYGVRKNLDSKTLVQGHSVSLIMATFDKISY